MNTLDIIKIKTKQTAIKTDQFFRENGIEFGIGFATVGAMLGIAGAVAMVAVSAPEIAVAAPVAALASIASSTTISVLGLSLNAAGISLIGGGFSGLTFAAFSKLYSSFRGVDEIWHDTLTGKINVDCIDNEGNLVEVPALKFYEMVEKGTLKNSYKEVIGDIHVGNGIHEQKRYSSNLTLEQASFIQGEDDIEKINRLLFKQTKDMSFASHLSDKLKNIRNNSYSGGLHPSNLTKLK